jgi:hypothetical protein
MVDRGIVKKEKVIRKRELYDEIPDEEDDTDGWENDEDIKEFLEQQDAYESDDSDELFTVAGMTNDKEESFNEFQKKQDEFEEADLDKDGVVTEEEKRDYYETSGWRNAYQGKSYWLHPWFDWSKRERWINDRDAINYWMNVKGGNDTALKQFQSEQYPTDFESRTY